MSQIGKVLTVTEGGQGNASLTAYAVLCGGTTSTAAVQSVAALGASGTVLTSNGAGALPTFQTAAGSTAFTSVNVQRVTATGAFTYTPTANLKFCIVELCAGGGGSGGIAATTNSIAISGAGTGGAYAKFLLTAAQVGASLTGSVGVAGAAGSSGNNAGGNGGDTTLATSSAWTCAGGTGGAGGASGASTTVNSAGGGAVTTGTGTVILTASGGESGAGAGAALTVAYAGCGGSSLLGTGGPGCMEAVATNSTAGHVGMGYGAGAGGSIAYGTASALAGTAGQQGIAIFTEFI